MISTIFISGAIIGGLIYLSYAIKKAPVIDDPDNVLSNADVNITALNREEKNDIHKMRMPIYDNAPSGKDRKKIKQQRSELVKDFPQITMQVKDIEAEIKKYNLKVITPPVNSSVNSRTAVVELNGEAVELVEFTKGKANPVD